MKSKLVTGIWALMVVLLASCTGTKYLKEGESFYTGASIDISSQGKARGRKIVRSKLEEYITVKPNTTILGNRPGVWFYYIAGNAKSKKGIRGFIKYRLGDKPVLLSDVDYKNTAALLQGTLNNKGFFGSEVTAQLETKNKKSTIHYEVLLHRAYRLRNISYASGGDSLFSGILMTLREESLLKEGKRYDLDKMKAEQERIEAEVENYGFYYFDDRYLIFEADSTVGDHEVDVDLKLEHNIHPRAKEVFRFKEVNIHSNYVFTARDSSQVKEDTLHVDGFIYRDATHNFRPSIITSAINIRKGDKYARKNHDLTLSHLMGMGTFKYVNIKYTDISKDSSLLKADVYLTPLKRKSIRMEVQGVSKSNNFVGPGLSFSFTNRNFLKGAELFQVKINTAYEVQVNSQLPTPLNSFELGIESSLTVPRFITPININYSSVRYLPKTQFKAGFNLQNRVNYFRLNSFNMGYGYNWRESISKYHELFPIDINYVKTDKTSPEFQAWLALNPALASSFEDQFIIGTHYSYVLNTQLKEQRQEMLTGNTPTQSGFYFNGNVDVAGNLLHAVQRGIKKGEDSPYQILGAPYSQYVKGDVDLRYYWQISRHKQLASRLVMGAGYAHGNSSTLPYIKQFSTGGSNSLRAFPARSVGPGTYNVRADSAASAALFIDQRGDVKLEGNVELRYDIIKSFKGAIFLDAGNIWLWNEDPDRPGGKFNSNTFMKQLAVGTGVGFRFDFSYFVLRLDIAFPLRKPYFIDDPWVINEIDFGSSDWRSENLIFNIAIGYPF